MKSISYKSMTDPRVDLKNPFIAAILAYLIPGAGHLYQRRFFKSAVYFVCILGTFFWGMHLGEWKIVYYKWEPTNKTLGFFAQVMIGLPALPAVAQHMRYEPPQNLYQAFGRFEKQTAIRGSLKAPFTGRVNYTNDDNMEVTGELVGQIELDQDSSDFVAEVNGTFKGTLDGKEVELRLAEPVEIGPQIYASENVGFNYIQPKTAEFASDRRYVMCHVVRSGESHNYEVGLIEGTVPRSFTDYYMVPVEAEAEQHLHGLLGKQVELALVFTWIAGLLNVLAVWDAFEGPAYGYGDEQPEEEKSEKPADPKEPEKPAPKPEAATKA